ncbi:undecaprenyl-diphosphatase [Paludibacterium purpuratum]|uniref:Undecaprenyl-diphosphatase n=1 Tax=Paludibacterium purpuratum TaxID=1144873 RepID=A0A4R7BC66_9NEIS|nr:undecaprenyl-diphosphatase [Paludibacterium purpuratum]TDR81495.1 undecaprenyl-diphosphatase [Paludibacterium purpuratum]
MESLNHTLFLWLNAAPDAGLVPVALAMFGGEMLIWALPLMLLAGWLRGGAATRRVMLEVFAAALLALAVNQLIGAIWPHPRPFMIGLGHTLIAHAADPSFPSDHMTLMSVTAASLWLQGWRRAARLWAVMALATAWGRIYLGVHFPFDMLGAIVVAYAVAWFCRRYGAMLLDPAHRLLESIWPRRFRP